MSNNYKLQKYEAICLILIVMVNKLILNVPYYIINLVGTGAVINLIYIGIIGLIFVLLLNYLFQKFPNSDIIDLSEFVGGKFLKVFVGLIFIVFFFLVSYITLTDFANMIKTIYFGNSPLIFILLFFMIGIIIANLIGLKSIIRTICLVVPFTLVSIILPLFAVHDEFSFDKFSPFFGYNMQTTFLNGILNIFSLYIVTYYYFLMPLLKDSFSFKKVTIVSYIISWTLLFLTVVSILTIFPITNDTEPLNSLYLLSRKIELGDFLQRLDALFVLLWLISIFCYLSVSTFMINRIIKKLTNISDEKWITLSTTSVFFGLCLLPFNVAISRFMENVVYRYLIIGLTFIGSFFLLILANLKFKFKKGTIQNDDEKMFCFYFNLNYLTFHLNWLLRFQWYRKFLLHCGAWN